MEDSAKQKGLDHLDETLKEFLIAFAEHIEPGDHVEERTLQLLSEGKLGREEHLTLLDHMVMCKICRDRVREFTLNRK